MEYPDRTPKRSLYGSHTQIMSDIKESGKVPLSRAIAVPWYSIQDTSQTQRLALFFDKIVVYNRYSDESDGLCFESSQRMNADLAYLAEHDVVARAGINFPEFLRFDDADGKDIGIFSEYKQNKEILFPIGYGDEELKSIPGTNNADKMAFYISKTMTYKETPVSALVSPQGIITHTHGSQAVQLTLGHVPLPPDDIPWEDLIQFREDAESKAYRTKIRLWLQERASSGELPSVVAEEMEDLMYEYRKYMSLQHKKYGEGILSTVILTAADSLEHLLNLKPGHALRALIDIRARKIAYEEAKLAAPGREVAYLAMAQDAFGRGGR